ncbi:MAG TPA: efflux RND transporter periplasmic adaptor subunit [Candidatus Saccharimonadales bacterium]|nr:efflux RND transporter periplasmic adaptor subunit [Candidatus Saccharimonadales bacterium]
MKKKWIIVGVVVVLVAIFGFSSLKRQQGKVAAVELSKVRREDVVSHVKAPGKIEPFTLVKMSATVPGKIVYLAVKEGQRVRRDEVLLRLDDIQYQADLKRAVAALSQAESRARQAKYNLDRAQQTLERNRALAQRNLVAPDQMEQVETAYNVARSEYQAAQDAVNEARAARATSQDYVDKTVFRAPFNGVVSQLNVEAGENVITGTMNNPGTQILAVADTTRMIVRAQVDETDVVDVKVGEQVKIKVDAIPDSVFRGQVIEVGNTAKTSSGVISTGEEQNNYEVKVVFLDHVAAIKPGMTADVDIQTNLHPKVLSVPIQSVVVRTQGELDQDKASHQKKKPSGQDAMAAENEDEAARKAKEKEVSGVFVVKKGVASFQPVKPGISGDVNTEVAGSLAVGDEIVSGPYKELRSLRDGAKVKRAPAKAAGSGEKKD